MWTLWLIYALVGVCAWVVAGPSSWPGTWSVCGAKSQSPINIKHDKTTHKDIGSMQFTGYETETSGHTFANNGHTGILRFFSQPVHPHVTIVIIFII